ncbi:MAG: type II toxin-antitoxin system HicA family toxin [Alphaproteobacteria bacterium]|nr:MAG: type II toxin-antitoxin system HicA family toxin [Alphaproteobacteria bacterium]
MRLPRDVSGRGLARLLSVFGYEVTRQTGGHMRLTTDEAGRHHLTIPAHDTLRVGTLAGIVTEVARHFSLDREQVVRRLFSR